MQAYSKAKACIYTKTNNKRSKSSMEVDISTFYYKQKDLKLIYLRICSPDAQSDIKYKKGLSYFEVPKVPKFSSFHC